MTQYNDRVLTHPKMLEGLFLLDTPCYVGLRTIRGASKDQAGDLVHHEQNVWQTEFQ
jgi:hypothetical protein